MKDARKQAPTEGASAFVGGALVVLLVAVVEVLRMDSAEGGLALASDVMMWGGGLALATALVVMACAPVIHRIARWVVRTVRPDAPRADLHIGGAIALSWVAATLPAVATTITRLEEVAHGVAWLLWTAAALALVSLGAVGISRLYGRLRTTLSPRWQAGMNGLFYVGIAILWAAWIGPDTVSLVDLVGGWDLVAAASIIAGGIAGLALHARPKVAIGTAMGCVALFLTVFAWNRWQPLPAHELARVQKDTLFVGPALRRWSTAKPVSADTTSPGHCGPHTANVRDVGRAGDKAPDILLITLDGVRFDYTSAGGKRRLTPKLQKWSKKGAVFSRAYAPAPSTRHSFRSIFSGLYPGVGSDSQQRRATKWGVMIEEDLPTLAEFLHESGFQTTALVSKPKAFPQAGGGLRGFDTVDTEAAQFLKRKRYSASFVVNQILGQWAAPHEAGKPRFLWTHIMDAHSPYLRPASVGPTRKLSPRKRYSWSIRYLDAELDRLLRWARSPERKDNTWVILTADHGEAWSEHGNRRHGATVYEEEIHVPLVVWGPGVVPHKHDAPVSLIDLLPTILDAAQLQVPDGLCGQSLRPSLLQKTPVERPVFVATLPDATRDYHHLAWIAGHEKLMVDGQTGLLSLYDLATDPKEKTDLGAEDTRRMAKAVDSLREFLKKNQMHPARYGLPTGPLPPSDRPVQKDPGPDASSP